MKNTIKLIGIICILLVIALSFAACEDGSGGSNTGATGGNTSLAGTTWKCTLNYGVSVTFTLTFTSASRVTLASAMMGMPVETYTGTYTFNGSTVNVNWDAGYAGSASYTLNGNRLTSSEGYVFTKQ